MFLKPGEPTRFAEYVAREIESRRCEGGYDWFGDHFYAQSIGRGKLRHDSAEDRETYKNTFCVQVWRGGWFWRKKCASLSRGHETCLPITDAEQERLYYVVKAAEKVHELKDKAEAKKRERLRLTDWP